MAGRIRTIARTIDDSLASQQLDRLVAEIAGASAEQSTGLSELKTAGSQMDKVTQRNSATADVSSVAAAELKSHAGDISGVVGALLRSGGGKRNSDAAGIPGESLPGGKWQSDPISTDESAPPSSKLKPARSAPPSRIRRAPPVGTTSGNFFEAPEPHVETAR